MALKFKGNIKTAGTLKGNAGAAAPTTLLGMIESLGLDNADLMVVLDANDPASLSNFEADGKWLNVAPGNDTAFWHAIGDGAFLIIDGKGNNVLQLVPNVSTKFNPANDATWQRTLANAALGSDGDSCTVIAMGSRTIPTTAPASAWWSNWGNHGGQAGIHSFEEGTTTKSHASYYPNDVVSALPGFPSSSEIYFAGWNFSKVTNQAGIWHNNNRIATGTHVRTYGTSEGPFIIGGIPGANYTARQYQFNAFAVWRNEITEQNLLDLYNLLATRIA